MMGKEIKNTKQQWVDRWKDCTVSSLAGLMPWEEYTQLKNRIVEINTTLKFEDKSQNEKKSYFEIVFATIIQTNEEIKEKKDMEKIILCDVQIEIYSDLEKALLNLLHNSGYPNIKFDKKVDFEKLYNERLN